MSGRVFVVAQLDFGTANTTEMIGTSQQDRDRDGANPAGLARLTVTAAPEI